MKKLATLLLAPGLAPGLAYAGSLSEEIAAATAPTAEYWIKPTLDIRARYEFGDVAGFDPSHAFTVRERLGLQTQEWNGFSAFVEGEFTQAGIDDFEGVPGPGAVNGGNPDDPSNTQIFDPETNELNQAYLQYRGFDTKVRVGRQRIIYDNAAFIGNVGWRQNEQTFDGISLNTTALDGFTFDYAYITQVNRIFGSDATNNFDFDTTNIHLINGSYSGIEGVTLGAYAYLLDFDNVSAFNSNTYGGHNTFSALGLDFYGEFAYQNEYTGGGDGYYAHGTASKKFGGHTFTAGIEYLSAKFRTPLATVHAFNGYADVFAGRRLSGGTRELNDTYLRHSLPLIGGIKMTNAIHFYNDGGVGNGLGWEANSVLVKKFDEHLTGITKLAYFESNDSEFGDTFRATVEMNYKF